MNDQQQEKPTQPRTAPGGRLGRQRSDSRRARRINSLIELAGILFVIAFALILMIWATPDSLAPKEEPKDVKTKLEWEYELGMRVLEEEETPVEVVKRNAVDAELLFLALDELHDELKRTAVTYRGRFESGEYGDPAGEVARKRMSEAWTAWSEDYSARLDRKFVPWRGEPGVRVVEPALPPAALRLNDSLSGAAEILMSSWISREDDRPATLRAEIESDMKLLRQWIDDLPQ